MTSLKIAANFYGYLRMTIYDITNLWITNYELTNYELRIYEWRFTILRLRIYEWRFTNDDLRINESSEISEICGKICSTASLRPQFFTPAWKPACVYRFPARLVRLRKSVGRKNCD